MQLNPLELAIRPFEVLGLDFMGPILPHSPLGNNHILVITDYFTKWVEVIPLKTTSALVTAKALMDCVILYHAVLWHSPTEIWYILQPTKRPIF